MCTYIYIYNILHYTQFILLLIFNYLFNFVLLNFVCLSVCCLFD